MTARPLAIVLGADTPIGLCVIRELGSRGVPVHAIGASVSAIGRTSRWTRSFSVRPPGRVNEWLPDLIRKTGAEALLAVSESDLIALAAIDPVVEGCRILTPRSGPLNIVLDKAQTLARAAVLGIDVPVQRQPRRSEGFAVDARGLSYPVVLKWADPPSVIARLESFGIEFIKAEYARDAEALVLALSRYDVLGAWPLVQSYCPGTGFGQMFHMQDGAATLAFQHRRIHEWPPEGGVSTLCASISLEQHVEQRDKSEALLRSIGWQGPAMVEYRHDALTGNYWLMEINGRFWGSLPLARHCGVEFAWESYAQAFGIDPARRELRERHARYTIPETRRLIRVLFNRQKVRDVCFKAKPLRDLMSYFTDFLDPGMRYYVFEWRDPAPFLTDMLNGIRKLMRRERRS